MEDVESYECSNESLCSLLVRPGFQEKISIIRQCCLQNSCRLLPNNSFIFCYPVSAVNGFEGLLYHEICVD